MKQITSTRVEVATRLVKYAQHISANSIYGRGDLELLRKLWGRAIWMLTDNPSLDEVVESLEKIEIPQIWRSCIQLKKVLDVITTSMQKAVQSIRHWLQDCTISASSHWQPSRGFAENAQEMEDFWRPDHQDSVDHNPKHDTMKSRVESRPQHDHIQDKTEKRRQHRTPDCK